MEKENPSTERLVAKWTAVGKWFKRISATRIEASHIPLLISRVLWPFFYKCSDQLEEAVALCARDKRHALAYFSTFFSLIIALGATAWIARSALYLTTAKATIISGAKITAGENPPTDISPALLQLMGNPAPPQAVQKKPNTHNTDRSTILEAAPPISLGIGTLSAIIWFTDPTSHRASHGVIHRSPTDSYQVRIGTALSPSVRIVDIEPQALIWEDANGQLYRWHLPPLSSNIAPKQARPSPHMGYIAPTEEDEESDSDDGTG